MRHFRSPAPHPLSDEIAAIAVAYVRNGVAATIEDAMPMAAYEAGMQEQMRRQREGDAAFLAAEIAGKSPAEIELIAAERQRFLAERGADTAEVRARKIAAADARLERAERAVLNEQSLSEAAE